jgi:hypothetical protein
MVGLPPGITPTRKPMMVPLNKVPMLTLRSWSVGNISESLAGALKISADTSCSTFSRISPMAKSPITTTTMSMPETR